MREFQVLDKINEGFGDYEKRIKSHIENPKSLQSVKIDSNFFDPLFQKISSKFDEGGYNGLLANFLQKDQSDIYIISNRNSDEAKILTPDLFIEPSRNFEKLTNLGDLAFFPTKSQNLKISNDLNRFKNEFIDVF